MRRHATKWALGALVTGLLLAPSHGALAHLPDIFEAGELLDIEDPLRSFALYGEFQRPDDFFEARMTPATPLAIPVEILVPGRDELAGHRPLFAIVGPGLPAPSAAERALLPRPLPEGTGAIVARYEREDREVIFESFTRRVFWTNGPTAYLVPAGEMRFWVWSPEGTTGKFVLGFGVEEGRQDPGDLLSNWGDYAY